MKRFHLENQPYHTISVTRSREPIFSKSSAAALLVSAINLERREGRAFVIAYSILPDHLHLLLVPRSPHDISAVMHHLKSYTAKAINKELGRSGPVGKTAFTTAAFGTKLI